MLRCSKEAFAKCPTRHLCGSLEEATFAENSECARFNAKILELPMTNGDRIRCMEDGGLALFLAEQMAKQNFMRLEDEGTKLSEVQKMALVERLYFTWLRWLKEPAEESLPQSAEPTAPSSEGALEEVQP